MPQVSLNMCRERSSEEAERISQELRDSLIEAVSKKWEDIPVSVRNRSRRKGGTMPHVSLTMYRGRSSEETERISQELRESLIKAVGWKAEDISVSVEETEPQDFTSIVNEKIRTEEIVIPSEYIKKHL